MQKTPFGAAPIKEDKRKEKEESESSEKENLTETPVEEVTEQASVVNEAQENDNNKDEV